MNQFGESVRVGALELCEHAVVEDEIGHRALGGEFFKDARVRRGAAFRFFQGSQSHLLEKNGRKLLGGLDVEFAPGHFKNRGCLPVERLFEFERECFEFFGIDENPAVLHFGEHPGKRKLDSFVEFL